MALTKNSIPVRVLDSPAYEELNATQADIQPGMLMERVSATTCRKNATTEKKAAVLVAIEDALQGKLVSDTYTNGSPVRLMHFRPGEEFHARLAAHQTISINEKLTSNGAGCFKSGTDSSIDQSECMVEAMEAAADSASTQLIRVRVI